MNARGRTGYALLLTVTIAVCWSLAAGKANGQTCGIPGRPACRTDTAEKPPAPTKAPAKVGRPLMAKGKFPVTVFSAPAGTIRKNSIGMELVWVPPGQFMMGSSATEVDDAYLECKKAFDECKRESFAHEMPKHRVTFNTGFWLGKYEVTQGDWQTVMGDNPSSFKDCGPNCPVEQVSWDDIQVFIRRLNAKDDSYEYSLPSEAQWEYAARSGATTAFAFGDTLNSSQANLDGEFPFASTKGTKIGKTVPAGSYKPSAWGLYDMHGNVWEWVQDIYSPTRYSAALFTQNSANVTKGDPDTRVLRGGSWASRAVDTRSAYRGKSLASLRVDYVGFRIAARPK